MPQMSLLSYVVVLGELAFTLISQLQPTAFQTVFIYDHPKPKGKKPTNPVRVNFFEKVKVIMKWFSNLKISYQIGSGFTLIILLLVAIATLTVFSFHENNTISSRVIELRQPTVIASTQLKNGINQSLAALRGWMILNNPGMKDQRRSAWKEINTAFEKMKIFSTNWTNPENIKRLDDIEQSLKKFAKAQQEIENISGTIDNTPATKMLITQAAPQASIIVQTITQMIDLESGEKANQQRKNLLGIMADVRGSMGMALANIRAYLLTGDNKFSKNFDRFWATNEKRFTDLANNKGLLTKGQKAAFEKLALARNKFSPLPPKMFAIRGSKQWNMANYWLGTKAAPEAEKIMASLVPMVKNQNELATTDAKLALDKSETSITFINTITVIGVILAIAIAAVISRSITRPLNTLLKAADDLRDGDGDLTQRLPNFGTNEIGLVTNAFNGFIEKIQSVLINVRDAAHQIDTASLQISSTAQSLSQGSSEQASSVEETSASLEQMSASIDQNTESAKATDAMARKTSSEAEQGGQAVKETVDAMTEIANKIGLIEDIAYKTNLLALNAAIEAARAGEHGKGFAVVADEVRKLAERSQVSSQEISELASNSVIVAQRAGNLLEEIVPGIQQTANLVMEITAASEEQSVGVNQVNQAIEQLDKVSQQNAAASEQLAATAEQMTSQSQQLQSTIGFFTLDNKYNEKQPDINSTPVEDAEITSINHGCMADDEKDFVSFGKTGS